MMADDIDANFSAQAKVRVTDENVERAICVFREKMNNTRDKDYPSAEFYAFQCAIEDFAASLSQGAKGESTDVSSFICYLIDNCEKEVIYEESLQSWFADFLKNPRYSQGAQGEAVYQMRQTDECQWQEVSERFYNNATYAIWQHRTLYTHPAERSAVPNGCVRVPREPLAKLKEIHDDCEGVSYAYRRREAQLQWDALTAAPQPPEGAP